MSAWMQVAFAVGGAVVGIPVSGALGTLPNQTGDGISLAEARENARAATVPRVRAPRIRTQRKTTSDDLFLIAIAALVAVGLYTVWAVVIAVAMFWVAVVTFIITVLVFSVLHARSVFGGGRTGGLLAMTLAYAFVGVAVAYWLVKPPLHSVLAPALAAIQNDGLVAVLPYAGPLGYQALGALASFAVLLSSIAVCMANVSAVLMEVGALGHSWLWKTLFRATRFATNPRVGGFYFGLAVLALLLSSGLAFEGILRLQAWGAATP